MPDFLNFPIMSYFVDACFPSLSLSKSMDSLKSSFTLFAWTPPPLSVDIEYQLHLKQASENAADQMLEQPETKQALVQRTCFLGGQQDKLEGVLATIGNFFKFARTLVSFYMNNLD